MDGHAAAKSVAAHAGAGEQVRPAVQGAWLVALAAAYVAVVAWAYRDYAMDDAYIGYRYVANLLAGNGFVFEAGTRVEGVTNIAWLLLLVPASLVGSPPLAAKLVAAILVGLTVWTIHASARRIVPRLAPSWRGYAVLPVAAAALALTSADFVAFSMLGMETAFLAAVLCAMAWFSIDRFRPTLIAALGALAFLAHPEAALVVPLALAIAVASRTLGPRDALRCLAVLAALVAAATAARWLYFGALLPNTFLAKPSPGFKAAAVHAIHYATGKFANISEPFTSPLALALGAVGYLAIRRAAPLMAAFAAAACVTGLLFGLYAAPDWTQRGRFFAPYAPLALLLLCAGALDIVRRLTDHARAPGLAAGALILAFGLPGAVETFQTISSTSRAFHPGYIMTSATLVPPARWIKEHLPPDAVIATGRVGALAYFGERRIFDYKFGLNDRAVAQLIRRHHRPFDDPHEAVLAELWQTRAPGYLLEDGHVVDRTARRTGTRESFRIHGLEYRVIKTFPIGANTEWTLAERLTPRS
jgi:hypothetical protein